MHLIFISNHLQIRFLRLKTFQSHDLNICIYLGHGVVIESHLGHVEIKNSDISDNYGNGVKTKFLNGRFYIFDDYMTFCLMANLEIQAFPQMISGIASGSPCGRVSIRGF